MSLTSYPVGVLPSKLGFIGPPRPSENALFTHAINSMTGQNPSDPGFFWHSLKSEMDMPAVLELRKLASETDREFFNAALASLGARLESEGKFSAAIKIYEIAGANRRLETLKGKGSFGSRFELAFTRCLKEANDYRTILPMLGASLVGHTIRVASLGRLLASADSGFFSRGVGARFSAAMMGYVSEVPVFTALSRTFAKHENAYLGEEIFRGALTLGALKVFGQLGDGIVIKLPGLNISRRWTKLAASLLPQLGGVASLAVSHRLEQSLGMRQKTDGITLFLDAISASISMGIGAKLGNQIMGPRFQNIHNELSLRSQDAVPAEIHRVSRNPRLVFSPIFQPMWMALGTGGLGGGGPRRKVNPPEIGKIWTKSSETKRARSGRDAGNATLLLAGLAAHRTKGIYVMELLRWVSDHAGRNIPMSVAFPTLLRMRESGLIENLGVDSVDGRRRYLKVSPLGMAELARLRAQYANLVRVMDLALFPKRVDSTCAESSISSPELEEK